MVNQKIAYILEKCKDKTVLDVGCGGAFAYWDNPKPEDSLIHDIAKVAKRVIGIDINKTAVKRLTHLGFEVYEGDAQSFIDPNTYFDVIVASDIIEHLPNLSGFFYCAKMHMKVDSVLILSSHYPYSINNFLRVLMKRQPNVRHDHICSFEKANLEYLCFLNDCFLQEFKLYTADDNRSLSLKIKSKLHRFIGDKIPGFNYGWYALITKRGV